LASFEKFSASKDSGEFNLMTPTISKGSSRLEKKPLKTKTES